MKLPYICRLMKTSEIQKEKERFASNIFGKWEETCIAFPAHFWRSRWKFSSVRRRARKSQGSSGAHRNKLINHWEPYLLQTSKTLNPGSEMWSESGKTKDADSILTPPSAGSLPASQSSHRATDALHGSFCLSQMKGGNKMSHVWGMKNFRVFK